MRLGVFLLFVLVIVMVGLSVRFSRFAAGLEKALLAGAPPARRQDLPVIVADFARRGMAGGTGLAGSVTLTQAAEMRLSKGTDWQPMSARQVVSTATPGFVWTATQRLGPLVKFRVVDSFVDGRGLLEVRLLGAIRLGREVGPAADRGEVLRYLAELPWSPDAILGNPMIVWDQVAPDRVSASLDLADGPASVVFAFTDGDISGMESAGRPAENVDGKPVLRDWRGHFGDYAVIGGRRVPATGEVGYVYPDGYEAYWRGEILTCQPR